MKQDQRTLLAVFGWLADWSTSSFDSWTLTQSDEKLKPKNSIYDWPISHFSELAVALSSLIFLSTSFSFLSWSLISTPPIIISSLILIQWSIPLVNSSTFFWNISAAVFIPKLSLLYWNKPWCVQKAVIYRESGCNSSWWYPDPRSSLENTFAPFSLWSKSSIVGVLCRCLCIALLASLASLHIRILFSF